MKQIYITLTVVLFMCSCVDRYTEEFTGQSPIYLTYDQLRESVGYSSPREIVHPGKIYFKDDYLFINEEMKGVHIIDNSDPVSPENIGFIEIPGNIDIAIKNNTLYADSYVDLVAISIEDIDNPVEIFRDKDLLPYILPSTESELPLEEVDQTKGVVVGWEVRKIRQEMEYYYYAYYPPFGCYDYAEFNSAPLISNGSSFGVGGSMARFGLYEDYLYIVDQQNLKVIDIKNDEVPSHIGSQYVGWDIETMFIYDGYMFFGMQSGMQIYNLDIPSLPQHVGYFWHTTSCDPVVVEDEYAFITLRGGTSCGGEVNRLDILQLADNYTSNTLIASYPMDEPYGLGVDDELLFICDGRSGLKIYDATDKLHIDDHMISSFPDIDTYDVIPMNGLLFMIGDDGFFQYDYSDIQNISLVSTIPVVDSE